MSAIESVAKRCPAYTEEHRSAYPMEYLAGIDLFNAREFYAAHDAWEERWLGAAGPAEKLFLQGLIQSAVAFYHLETGRRGAARAMYQRAQEKFARFETQRFMSLDLEEFQAQLDRALGWLLAKSDPRVLTPPTIEWPVIRLSDWQKESETRL